MAVRGGVHDRLGADIAVRAWPVLYDEWLAEPLRQPLSDQACHDVGGTTGRKSDNDAHRPRWIGLRPSDALGGRERGSACGQMQKISAGKLHLSLPPFTSFDHLVGAREQRGSYAKIEH